MANFLPFTLWLSWHLYMKLWKEKRKLKTRYNGANKCVKERKRERECLTSRSASLKNPSQAFLYKGKPKLSILSTLLMFLYIGFWLNSCILFEGFPPVIIPSRYFSWTSSSNMLTSFSTTFLCGSETVISRSAFLSYQYINGFEELNRKNMLQIF